MATPNAELAYKVLDHVERHRAAFNMDTWVYSPDDTAVKLDDLLSEKCGTTACFAGWAILLSGYEMRGGVYRDGELVASIFSVFAADLLGLSGDQADDLFYADDEDVKEAVADIFGPRPAASA